MYRYSTHYSKRDAQEALEDYFASGEVTQSEFAEIKISWPNGRARWDILLWDRG